MSEKIRVPQDELGEYLKTAPRFAWTSSAPGTGAMADYDEASLIGASRIVDGIPQVDVVGERPWQFDREVLTPAGNALSTAGQALLDAGKGVLGFINDTFVRPSGSTNEISQRWGADLSLYTVRNLSREYSRNPTGQTLVPIDSAAEARRAANNARVATNVALAAGGPLTGYAAGAQLLGAPNDVVNNIGVAASGVFGSVAIGSGAQPIYIGPRSLAQQFGVRSVAIADTRATPSISDIAIEYTSSGAGRLSNAVMTGKVNGATTTVGSMKYAYEESGHSRIVSVNMYEISAGFRGQGLSTRLFSDVQARHQANMFEGAAGFDNAAVMSRTGDISATPWSKAMDKLGFTTTYDPYMGMMTSTKR
ncbi:hypothetical protein [Pseudoduganella chitinolytica]|uniref:N-acetyltransferase domain-containing protein n=1 Tax=Pseudoduganella chitinolytica TaxID=34070 RepID=A0ABY8BCH1_9BURK|nr:hypothetical protein [Pseudoduganella chitinolytica]WEF32868.1 hypothetical protein PX653_26315 [Pseudoduganella chitinolytica]